MPNPDDGDADDKQAFIDQMSSPIPHVLEDPGELWLDHGVVSQPTVVFVAADGTTETHIGALGPQALTERLKSLAVG